MVEREGSPKVKGLRAAMPQSVGQRESGWSYGFRHPIGFIPQRTLSGFPSAGHMGHGRMGAPAVPKPQHHTVKQNKMLHAKPPKMPRIPNPSMGPKGVRKMGHFKPNPSMKPKMRLASEAKEPPEGAYSRQNSHETKDWFKEKPIKAGGPGSGRHKEILTALGYKFKGKMGESTPGDLYQHPISHRQVLVHESGAWATQRGKQIDNGTKMERYYAQYHPARDDQAIVHNRLEANQSELYGPAISHMHIQPIDTFHPPSLVKRGKQDHVPTDDPGETSDKYLDKTKRDSEDTKEFRMKLLKRQAPGGSPALIPARTTLIPEHSGVYLPTSMMSAEKPRPNQRPVNWNRQTRQRVSYQRRGCM